MYTVAVCDDEQTCVEANCQLVSEILEELNSDFIIKKFYRAEQLYEALMKQPHDYQLLLLDVKFPAQSGVDVARMLRACAVDVSIIFISAYDDFALEGYDVRAIQYLLKPIDREKLRAAVAWDYEKYRSSKPIVIRTKDGVQVVKAREILCVESFYKKVTVYLVNGEEIQIFGTIKTLKQQLPTQEFTFCHKSYLVNLDYVQYIKRYEVLLLNGKILPASKGYYESFRLSFLKH